MSPYCCRDSTPIFKKWLATLYHGTAWRNLFSVLVRRAITNGQGTAHSALKLLRSFGKTRFPAARIAANRCSRSRAWNRLLAEVFLSNFS